MQTCEFQNQLLKRNNSYLKFRRIIKSDPHIILFPNEFPPLKFHQTLFINEYDPPSDYFNLRQIMKNRS